MSQKSLILKKLREQGYVTRNACIRGEYGMFITRLSDIMLKLKQDGINWEGYQYQHPNDYEYKLLDKPKEIIEYKVGGEIVSRKVVW